MIDASENAEFGQLVKTQATRYDAPQELRQSIISAVALAAAPTIPPHPSHWWQEWPWLKLGTAMACGIFLSVMLTPLYFAREEETRISEEVVGAHVRSLMVAHLEDIASTDQHTVKPWFAGKLDFSPPVNDFAEHGFPLSGGRLEYIDRHLTAALIYHRHGHVINVFVWPIRERDKPASTNTSQEGFNLMAWNDAKMQFWLVSDVNAEDLQQFSNLLRKERPL